MPAEKADATVQGVIDNDPRRALELNARIYKQGPARCASVLRLEESPADLIEQDLINIREEITGEFH